MSPDAPQDIMKKSRKRKGKEAEPSDKGKVQKPSKKLRSAASEADKEASELNVQAVLPTRTRKGGSVTLAEARKAAGDLAESLKGRVKTVSQKPPRARKLILDEVQEEEEKEATEDVQTPLVDTLKQLSPEKLVEVAKLSEDLQRKTAEQCADCIRDKASEACAEAESAHVSGNTHTEKLIPLNSEKSPSQKNPKTSKPSFTISLSSSDSSDSESDVSRKSPPPDQPQPLQVEQPKGFTPVAGMHVDAAIAHIAANNPDFAVHHAMYTANKNLREKAQTSSAEPSSSPQAIDVLSSHMCGELPKTPPETSTNPSYA